MTRKQYRLVRKKFLRLVRNPIFPLLTIAGNLLIFTGAIVVYFLERDVNPNVDSLLDTVWWAVATVTTVGYGDVSPVTVMGKIVGIVMMILGTALFWSYTALFADAVLSEEIDDLQRMIDKKSN